MASIALAAACVLVRREPQQPPLLEVLQGGTQLVAGEHRGGIAQAAALHRPLHRPLVVRPVHAGQRCVVAHQTRGDLQRREVARHDDDAAPAGLRCRQVLQAFDAHAAPHRRDATPPGTREFKQADAEFAETRAGQRVLPRRVQLGETQGDVAPGHVATVAHQREQHGADAAPQWTLQGPRQARGQPGQADAGPGGPLAQAQGRTRIGVGGSLLGVGHGPL